jgi:protein-S-isoprenylcysteine O-methyltransferase Ste14
MVHPILQPLQLVAFVELTICWIAWLAAFVQRYLKAAGQKEIAKAPSARWGILLNVMGFACLWVNVRPPGFEKSAPELIASMLLGPPSVVLAWRATRHLGRHWRYQAALNANHELVKTGPYASIRHPIYASMLGMVLASGAAYTWWPMLVAGLILFLIGTEIRVQAEDRLLEMYFQDEFIEYRARVRAYIPLFR